MAMHCPSHMEGSEHQFQASGGAKGVCVELFISEQPGCLGGMQTQIMRAEGAPLQNRGPAPLCWLAREEGFSY